MKPVTQQCHVDIVNGATRWELDVGVTPKMPSGTTGPLDWSWKLGKKTIKHENKIPDEVKEVSSRHYNCWYLTDFVGTWYLTVFVWSFTTCTFVAASLHFLLLHYICRCFI